MKKILIIAVALILSLCSFVNASEAIDLSSYSNEELFELEKSIKSEYALRGLDGYVDLADGPSGEFRIGENQMISAGLYEYYAIYTPDQNKTSNISAAYLHTENKEYLVDRNDENAICNEPNLYAGVNTGHIQLYDGGIFAFGSLFNGSIHIFLKKVSDSAKLFE